MSVKNDEIKISEIVELIEGSLEDFEKDVREQEYSTKELKKILDAEKADKDRKKAKRFIRRQIKKQEIIDQLDVAESDVEEIKSSLEYIRDEQNLERIGDTEELDRHELLEIVGGTVKDLKKYLKDHNPSKKQLEELLESEEMVKDRKTAKKALKAKLNKRKIEEDVKNAEEDVEKLEEDIVELENDSKGENPASNELEIESSEENNTEKNEEDIESEMDDLESENQQNVNKDEGELQKAMEEAEDELNNEDNLDEFIEDLEEEEESDIFEDEELKVSDVENNSEEAGKTPGSEIEGKTETASEDDDQVVVNAEITQGSESSKPVSEASENSNGSADETSGSGGKSGSEAKEDEDSSMEEDETDAEETEEEDEEENDNFEEKKEILDDLDVNLSDEEMKEISLEDLKEIKKEKMDRKDLISKLSEEGLNEETLRNSSTKDLRKLSKDLLDDEDEGDKDQEEIEEEAQEDLEMLMGAGRSDGQNNESSDNRFENIKDTKEKIINLIHGEKEAATNKDKEKTRTQKMEKESIIEVLDKYRELDDSNEAAIKTAHVMKGFLEYKYNIDKEKTYKQLAEELEEKRDEENFQKFLKFLKKLHEDEYVGNIKIENIDEIIDKAETVVEDIG